MLVLQFLLLLPASIYLCGMIAGFCKQLRNLTHSAKQHKYDYDPPPITRTEFEDMMGERQLGYLEHVYHVSCLEEQGYSHREACNKVGCCAGCYIPCDMEYCEECYDEIMRN